MELDIRYERDAEGKKVASSLPERNREWVLAFVAENSVKGVGEIEALVQGSHDELMRAVEGLTDEQVSWRPAEGVWCVLEAMAHIVSSKMSMAALSRTLAAGMRPPGAEQFEEMSAQDGLTTVSLSSIAEAREMAEKAQGRLLEVVRGLDSANTETRFKHYIFGEMNAREWAVFQVVHDGDHLPQIERVRESPGFPSAGV